MTSATRTTTAQPGPPTSDLVFGRYQIIRRLAIGGMGEVFLARQSGVAGFDRLVILKSLLPDLASQEDFVQQFLDEARTAAMLNHPNIVSIYEVGMWNGTYFIAMEYIKGDNLSRLQRAAERAKRKLPIDVAAFVAHEAAHALDHAHKATDLQGKALHIVHRDVSPQNIMVRTDGVTKVVDFGIAKAANRVSRTATGLLKGKAQYMAPEQVSGVTDIDGRCDQFALGVVLWELVAGRKLFQGNNDIDVLRAVISSSIPPLSEVIHVDPRLDACVARMLERERNDRYPTLAEAAADLKRFLEAGGMKNAQEHTSEFVADMLGEEISAKTVDLTPSSSNNFVINLAPPSTSPTVAGQGRAPRSRAAIGIAAGLVVALGLAAVAAAVIVTSKNEPATNAFAVPAPGAKPKIAVATEPAGVSVNVDGKDVGKSPVTLELEPDVEHTITATGPGFEPHVEKVKLARGQMAPMMFALVVKKAHLSVVASIVGADVKIDGKDAGKSPLDVDIEPGPHDVRATFSKGKDAYVATTSVTLAPGDTHTLPMKLDKVATRVASTSASVASSTTQPDAPALPAKAASFTLDTKPWAKLYVDGKYVDSTPVSKIELPSGSHKIRLVNEASNIDETRTITLKPGESFKQSWPLKPK